MKNKNFFIFVLTTIIVSLLFNYSVFAEENNVSAGLFKNSKNQSQAQTREVIVGGEPVGVKLVINGVMVIGFSLIKDEHGNRITPAKEAGIKEGDIIVSANQTEIISNEQMSEIIEKCDGKEIEVKVLRDGKEMTFKVKPVISQKDGRYKIGTYIRNSNAGVGILTFVDPQNKAFAALGHGITDVDTLSLLNVKFGSITDVQIFGIQKGQKGSPGELKAYIATENEVYGDIYKNDVCGIYGKYKKNIEGKELTQVAAADEVKTGKAYIITTTDKQKEFYEIKILKLNTQNYDEQKGMIIKITDKRLLDKTGGIVQGMSGSPIIQNGRLVGAVTHVLIDEPTKGYAIFAENMLETAQSVAESNKLKDAS